MLVDDLSDHGEDTKEAILKADTLPASSGGSVWDPYR